MAASSDGSSSHTSTQQLHAAQIAKAIHLTEKKGKNAARRTASKTAFGMATGRALAARVLFACAVVRWPTSTRADPQPIDSIGDFGFEWPGELSFHNSSLSFDDRAILRDGQPFLVRGVTYSPSPIGSYGPLDEDLFRPENAAVWERDLPLMAHAGINSIRV